MNWRLEDRLEAAEARDAPLDFCQWPYERPVAPAPDALRTSALLYKSFALAGVSGRMLEFCDALVARLGRFRTVWGIKWADGRLSWEFYFYDYARMERRFGMGDFIDLARPFFPVTAPALDGVPHFMFSVELDAALIAGQGALDRIDMYMGNPGSAVSSGICYGVSRQGCEMRNFYFFFDARSQMQEVREKLVSNAHLPMRQLELDRLLWPRMKDAQIVVVANKRWNDGLYFSRIGIDPLVHFLERLRFPEGLTGFARESRDRLAHHLFDVGYDHAPGTGRDPVLLKGSIYGLL
ncbi:hypothetical protein HMH01_07930 [Halovulum dunhuangense]|uniref:Uncharacterized protein n=1 Tax=Halovulum dunhuangense TaxID=1505036 RepID=A0A849L275_9RHOB|nr:hypothetical protein [Halovulum dunhuangense]NNU80369.1 hypothetical protein [Halovulum dunhuangense]